MPQPEGRERLLDLLATPMAAVSGADLADADAVRLLLESAFPFDGAGAATLRGELLTLIEAGSLCDRGEEGMRFSRLVKPRHTPHDVSVDVVWMNAAGPRHRHPRGEANLCFAVEGDPRFDGQPEGWVVFRSGSEHVPTVTGGRMLIVYLLPGGALEWVEGDS